LKEKILILGGTGFIGYHLAKEALRRGFQVSSLSKNI
jgi:nucleoside-diphosphate-sugar epimerase